MKEARANWVVEITRPHPQKSTLAVFDRESDALAAVAYAKEAGEMVWYWRM